MCWKFFWQRGKATTLSLPFYPISVKFVMKYYHFCEETSYFILRTSLENCAFRPGRQNRRRAWRDRIQMYWPLLLLRPKTHQFISSPIRSDWKKKIFNETVQKKKCSKVCLIKELQKNNKKKKNRPNSLLQAHQCIKRPLQLTTLDILGIFHPLRC